MPSPFVAGSVMAFARLNHTRINSFWCPSVSELPCHRCGKREGNSETGHQPMVKEETVARDRPTILQIVPQLDTGGAELSAIEIVEAVVRAGGRALLLAEPGGRLAPRVAAAGGELIAFPAATKNPIRLLANARAITRIVQNLVNLHGGTFELRSELRKGTEAVVCLPKSRVLRTMPPLQPLGQERHRRPVAPPPRPTQPRSVALEVVGGSGVESTVRR